MIAANRLCGPLAAGLMLAVAGTAPAEPPPYHVAYRLMAYNVASAANVPLGTRQIGQIADTIIDNRVDVAGLTEVELGTGWHQGRDHVAELCVALADRGWPMHVYKWAAFELQGGWQTPALLSRFPIETSGYDAVEPPSGNRWCVGHITVRLSEHTTVMACMTHFWPQGDPKACAAAVRKLVELPNRFAGPRTIMGDFNLTPASPLYAVVTGAGWRNACEVVHGSPCPSVQGQAGIAGPLPLTAEIDYIFGSPEIEFVDAYVGYFSMADHWPVFAEARVPIEGPAVRASLPDTTLERSATAPIRASAAALYRSHDYAAAADAYGAWERACTDPDEAGFAAYSAACMQSLAGNDAEALRGFEQVAKRYPGSEWSARADYRRAFLLQAEGRWAEAERAFEAYLDGYYTQIHPDVKSPAVLITAREIARCRSAAGTRTTAGQVLADLARRDPTGATARAAAYRIAYQTFPSGDKTKALEYLKQADPSPHGLWPNEAKVIAEAYLAAGDRQKSDAFYAQFLNGITDPLNRRVRVARRVKETDPDALRIRVPRVAPVRIDGNLDDWPIEPLVVLRGPPHLYRIDPAAPVDELAAEVHLGWTDRDLLIALDVTDDVHDCPYRGSELFKGDSLQIAIDPAADATRAYNDDDIELGVALTADGTRTHVWQDRRKRDWSQLDAAVRREGSHTRYEVAIPMSVLAPGSPPPEAIGLDLLVNDADGGPRHAWLDWTPGIAEEKSPALYPSLILAR